MGGEQAAGVLAQVKRDQKSAQANHGLQKKKRHLNNLLSIRTKNKDIHTMRLQGFGMMALLTQRILD